MKKQYVVEIMNGVVREWWTGVDWSNIDMDAEWYDQEEAEEIAATHGGSATYFD